MSTAWVTPHAKDTPFAPHQSTPPGAQLAPASVLRDLRAALRRHRAQSGGADYILWFFGRRQALFSLAGGQCGSVGGVRQPTADAWSISVRVARATIGRVSSAR